MFVLLVASELYGSKHNIEVGFPAVPCMSELIGHVESTLQIEHRLMRPASKKKERFRLEYVQIYDEVLQRWVDLLSSTQLHDWAQLYVFQHAQAIPADMQAQLPSTRPIRSAFNGVHAERLWQLFQDTDVNGNGYVERDELQRIFSVLGMFEFPELQVDDFFVKADTNRDGVLSYAEFSKFAAGNAPVVQALFQAGTDYLDAVKTKNAEKTFQKLRQDEAEARYDYLTNRQEVAIMEEQVALQHEVMMRAEGEATLQERNAQLAAMRNQFVTSYRTDPASPHGSPVRSLVPSGHADRYTALVGYARARKYPRAVSSPRFGRAE